jgi:hypothetical protein
MSDKKIFIFNSEGVVIDTIPGNLTKQVAEIVSDRNDRHDGVTYDWVLSETWPPYGTEWSNELKKLVPLPSPGNETPTSTLAEKKILQILQIEMQIDSFMYTARSPSGKRLNAKAMVKLAVTLGERDRDSADPIKSLLTTSGFLYNNTAVSEILTLLGKIQTAYDHAVAYINGLTEIITDDEKLSFTYWYNSL